MRSVHAAPAALLFALFALRCGASADSSAMGSGGMGGVGGSGGTPADGGQDTATCGVGEITCKGDTAWTCTASGTLANPTDCASSEHSGKSCVDGLGCVVCEPGTGSCENGEAWYCTPDGANVITFTCDPLQGMECKANGCVGSCAPSNVGRSHVGCDFWPTVTPNSVWGEWFSFGVVVTNATSDEAHVVITRGQETIVARDLEAEGFAMIELPWVDELKGPEADMTGAVSGPVASVWSTNSDGGGAYRLRTDRPVTVVQFNTLNASNPNGVANGCPADAKSNECLSYTNDASLLVPTSALGSAYEAIGWHAWHFEQGTLGPLNMGDFLSVTATEPSTTVTITPRSTSLALAGEDPLEPGKEHHFTLQQGDVLQLFTEGKASEQQWSGSPIRADHPIQVLTGAACVNIPDTAPTCDHVEEWVPPLSMLGKRYLVSSPTTPSGRGRYVVRVHGLTEGTVVTFDPSTVHKPVTLTAGETLEMEVEPTLEGDGFPSDFLVTSDQVFAITQYMVGHGVQPYVPDIPGADMSDPSQTVLVPTSRFVKSYALALPPGFDEHRITIAASTGSEVRVNDEPIASSQFTAVGASGLSVARLAGLAGGKRYVLTGDSAFGVQVFGYGKLTSYMFPGGMDLRPGSAP